VKAAGFPGQILLPKWILLELPKDSHHGKITAIAHQGHQGPGAPFGPFLQDSVHFLPYSDTQLCHFDLIGTAAQLFLGWCPAVAKLCQTKDEEGGF